MTGNTLRIFIINRVLFFAIGCSGGITALAARGLAKGDEQLSADPQSQMDTTILPRQTMSALRKMPAAALSSFSEGVYVTDGGREGIFEKDAADSQTPDDSAMTLVTMGGTRYKRITENGVVNARWFGAIPGDGKDDWASIQKAADFCISHGDKYTTVHLGPGLYIISQPIILYRWGGSGYSFHSTGIEGESSFWEASGSGTILQCTFKDKFAIGIQLGKGNKISRLKIIGQFKPPFLDKFSFYQSTFEQFVDPTCRDSNFSPYSGIVIDPFSNSSAQVPPDGGYPGYASWNRGSGGVAGSTGVSIDDVFISGFVVGICSSPNSFTRNAELTYINKIQFSDMKLCIAASQDQEKGNVVSNLGCWGTVHTVFATGLYGEHTPGNWYVENANIAGYVNRLVYNPQSGYFASHFKNIFSESLGRLGKIQSNQGTIVESSEFGFAYYSENTGQYIFPQVECSGVTFIGCNFRMYGTFKPVTIKGNGLYIGCSFETVPFTGSVVGDEPTYENCPIGTSNFPLGVNGVHELYASGVSGSFAYGHYTISVWPARLTVDNVRPAESYPIFTSGRSTVLAVTARDGIRSASVVLAPDDAGRVKKGDVVCSGPEDKDPAILGVVTEVTANGFTFSYIPSQVVTGHSYHLCLTLPLCNIGFLGDVTTGSNQITNVRLDLGNFDRFLSMGGLMLSDIFENRTGVSNTGARGTLFRITGYDAARGTVTIDQPSGRTATGLYFSNANAVKDIPVEGYKEGWGWFEKQGAAILLQEGGRIYIRDPSSGARVSYLVTKSGFYNAAVCHDARQARWVRESPVGGPGGSRGVGGASLSGIDAGAGAGKGATVTIAGGDAAGEITITAGATPLAGAIICTVHLSAATDSPFVTLSPATEAAAGIRVYTTMNGKDGFSIHGSAAGGVLLPGQTYKWTYMLAR